MRPASDVVLQAAYEYAEHRWRVLPLDGKIPLTVHGSHDASTVPMTLERWFTTYPCNVGIATGPESGLWVLDADGAEGIASLKALRFDGKPLWPCETPWVRTGGGGVHVYFAWDDRVAQRAKFLPGLDTRARGGYVVAPPSIHPETHKPYEWLKKTSVLAAAPPGLIDLVARKKPVTTRVADRSLRMEGITPYGKKALDASFEELSTTTKGGRDDKRNVVSYSLGRLVAGGHVTREDAVEALAAACERNGLLEDEGEPEIRRRIERAIDDGIAAGPRGPAPAQTGAAR